MGSNICYNSFKLYLQMGKAHGITKEEIMDEITKLAFYIGWPKAWAAFDPVKEVYGVAK